MKLNLKKAFLGILCIFSLNAPAVFAETTTKSLTKENFSLITTYYFVNTKNPNGELIMYDGQNIPFVEVSERNYFDDKIGWCQNPTLPTVDGTIYTGNKTIADLDSALISAFGLGYSKFSEKDNLLTATNQAMIWEKLGYQDVFSNPYALDKPDKDTNYIVRFYTDEENKKVEDFKSTVNSLAEKFKAGVSGEFSLENSDLVEDLGNLNYRINLDKLPKNLIFSGNSEVLEYYKNGTLKSEGVNSEIDSGKLNISIPEDIKEGKYEVKMSMIRQNHIGESYLYTADTFQPIMDYRISDPKWEKITLEFYKEKVETPEEPKDEEPKDEPKDEEPKDEPKDEEPKDEPKDEEPKDETPKEEPKKPEEPKGSTPSNNTSNITLVNDPRVSINNTSSIVSEEPKKSEVPKEEAKVSETPKELIIPKLGENDIPETYLVEDIFGHKEDIPTKKENNIDEEDEDIGFYRSNFPRRLPATGPSEENEPIIINNFVIR